MGMTTADTTCSPSVLHQLPIDTVCRVVGFLDSGNQYRLQCTCKHINAVIGERDITMQSTSANPEYMATLESQYPFLTRLSIHIDDNWRTLGESVSRVTFPNLVVLVFASKGSPQTKQDVDRAIDCTSTNTPKLLHDWVPRLQVLDIGSLNQNDIPIVTRMLTGHRYCSHHPLCIVNKSTNNA